MAKNKEQEKVYKEEGKRRSRIRKANRYNTFNSKGNGTCIHSRKNDWHSCPFQEDMNSNYDVRYCRCCSSCRHECTMDI